MSIGPPRASSQRRSHSSTKFTRSFIASVAFQGIALVCDVAVQVASRVRDVVVLTCKGSAWFGPSNQRHRLTPVVATAMISPEIMRAKPKQLEFPTHGGRREGAGRPRGNRVSHAARPQFDRVTPVHVTLRMREYVWNLRSGRSFRRIKACFEKSRGLFGARLIEFSVQGNHLHLIIEVDDSEALSRGMQGLCIRIAKALNRMMQRTGKVFADHYHSHLLRSPTELVNAIRYVLDNAAHHFGLRDVDPYSSRAPEGRAVVA